MQQNVKRCGGEAIMVQDTWGEPTDANKLEQTLKAHPDAKMVAFVHAETSTGVRNDAQRLCALAKQYDCLTIVDAVTSLGGIELDVDGWQIDAVYSGTQKCLSCVPGLSPYRTSQ
ncbi:MAG: alanine-glyoxylate transaminase/serine-glyoxylate transaminase/serine-pyruvate transaminase [Paraglaciecola sp.]|jgi:alanine-glyoxylate transaminase/serine-glyoxylate transaminase/serine-pyruvate transaminase